MAWVVQHKDLLYSVWKEHSGQDSTDTMLPYSVEQYAGNVRNYSSQYCNRFSISYSVRNMLGPPTIYPQYGDLPEAFAMRTYGKWWEKAPSHAPAIQPQSLNAIRSQDFVEITFDEEVIPRKISVYETFNPGSIVRIWVADELTRLFVDKTIYFSKWYLAYEAEPSHVGPTSRKFEHSFEKPFTTTTTLRIEFNHSLLDYYAQFDAATMSGWRLPPIFAGKLDLSAVIPSDDDVPNKPDRVLRSAAKRPYFPLDDLPVEILLNVLAFLDLKSLSRTARVNRKFRTLAYDPSLYTELNLKDYWWCAHRALPALAKRCHRLRKLDISWGVAIRRPFKDFMTATGRHLTHLHANSVDIELPNGTDLVDLSITSFDLAGALAPMMQCHRLVRLNLYNTTIHTVQLVPVLQENRSLKHLNLGSCLELTDLDLVTLTLARFNQSLESLDLWKTISLTASGVNNLAALVHLQELDLGWSLGTNDVDDSLLNVVTHCKRLTRLVLGACRSLSTRDVLAIAEHCTLLTQLDLVGIPIINCDACNVILSRMPNLELLDVNFCAVHNEDIDRLRAIYPKVSIKSSL